jgi:hypothetical protein
MTAALAIVLLLGTAFVAFTSGPEGSALAKDTQEQIESAAKSAGLVLNEVRTVSSDCVPLPIRVAWKRRFKHGAGVVGMTVNEAENCIGYLIGSPDLEPKVRCFVRSVGDHVIGIVVSFAEVKSPESARFLESLKKEFPNYEILIRDFK